MISEGHLQRWQRLASAATEGPWYAYEGPDYSEISLNDGTTPRRETPLALVGSKHKDAIFIATSREAVPELIKTVRELEGVIKQTCSFCCGWLEMKCSTAKGDKCPVYKRKVEKDVQDD